MAARSHASKANKMPTDLGVLGLAEVKAALSKMKGPPSTLGSNIQPDDFSQLDRTAKMQVAIEGRKRANDRLAMVKSVASTVLKIYLANRVLTSLFQRLISSVRTARGLSTMTILVTLYNRWGAWKRLSTEEYRGPQLLPFFGGMLEMAAHKAATHDHLLKIVREADFNTLEIPVTMNCFVVLMDARDREYVLKTNPWNFMKNRADDPAAFEVFFAELLGRGIFATDKSEWLESRKIASHMFSGHALRTQMGHVFNGHADRVCALLEATVANPGRVVDMQEVFQCAVFDAFCEIAFGIFPNAIDAAVEGRKPQFLVSFDFAQNVSSERVMTPPVAWQIARLFAMVTGLGTEGEFIKHVKLIDQYVNDIIDQRLAEENIDEKNDLLSLYIKYSRAQSEPFSREDYRDIIVNFMIAGRDTTSCTLTYATKFLGENPHVQTRLREQGFFELGASAPLSWEESKTIPYADAVVNEVLRMAPPVGDDLRLCVADDVLPSGLKVRCGSRVVLCNMAIGRDPFLWSNPDTFDPERWMKYDSAGVPQPVRRVDEYVHPIFFAGRRLCLGKDMARFEAVVFMNKIFSRFNIIPLPNQSPTMVMGPVIFLKEGHKCKVESR